MDIKSSLIGQRKEKYNALKSKENTHIFFINGKYKGLIGEVIRVGKLRNNKYNNNNNQYNNYFDLTVLVDDIKVVTSCRNVKLCS